MEFKVKQESHTLLEKMFATNSKGGVISPTVVPSLLKELNTEIEANPEEFTQFMDTTTDLAGGLDWNNFEKLMIHYLAKQSRKESDAFDYKHVIGLADFDTP